MSKMPGLGARLNRNRRVATIWDIVAVANTIEVWSHLLLCQKPMDASLYDPQQKQRECDSGHCHYPTFPPLPCATLLRSLRLLSHPMPPCVLKSLQRVRCTPTLLSMYLVICLLSSPSLRHFARSDLVITRFTEFLSGIREFHHWPPPRRPFTRRMNILDIRSIFPWHLHISWRCFQIHDLAAPRRCGSAQFLISKSRLPRL